ncbi:hypothetical protein ACGFX4_06555 [Kitasatospora sp. NPDC048365]|uniref:hypothetical protein n=1 Tax=Kitasatospora sp. NPDC048365 TaxID=3364050 RepID=UPI00371468AE
MPPHGRQPGPRRLGAGRRRCPAHRRTRADGGEGGGEAGEEAGGGGVRESGPSTSPAPSPDGLRGVGIRTRKVAVLVAPGADGPQVRGARALLGEQGATVETLTAHTGGEVPGPGGEGVPVGLPLPTTASVLRDAVVPDGAAALASDSGAVRFVAEAVRHGKPVAVLGTGTAFLRAAGIGNPERLPGSPSTAVTGWWTPCCLRR